MSRVAKKPINLPKGVELTIQPEVVSVKGPKGTLSLNKAAGVEITLDNGVATLSPKDISFDALTGTVRAILANMVQTCPKASSASWSWSAWVTALPCRART